MGSWEGAASLLPSDRESWGVLKAPLAGPAAETRKIWVLDWSILGPQKSRQNGQLAFERGEQQVPLPQRRTAPAEFTDKFACTLSEAKRVMDFIV